MSSDNLPLIKAFPKGDALWRIDWFGDIAFPDRSTRGTQPSVFIRLSRVRDSESASDNKYLLDPASTDHAKFQRGCWVSVGTLPLLRVGDLWRDGQLFSRPDYQLETFPTLDINSATTTLIKAGLNKDESG